MLAKEQRVVARRFGIETTVPAVVGFNIRAIEVRAITMDPIEHRLDAAGIAGEDLRAVAKERRGHVLDGIEPKAIALGCVKRPHSGADQIRVYVFGNRYAVASIEGPPGTAEQGTRRVPVIFRIRRLADEEGFWRCAAERVAEIAVH